jgi:hypothetical protein
MRSLLLLSVCLLSLASAPAGDPPVARLGDRTFEADDFSRWLLERYGVIYVKQFVVETLVLQQAEARGLTPSEAEVAQRYEDEYAHIVEKSHGGNEARWLGEIAARGYSPEGWRARRTAELTIEMAQEALVRVDREPTEELVAQRFRDLYGPDGEHVALQVLFFSAYRDVDVDQGFSAKHAPPPANERRIVCGCPHGLEI